MNPTLAWLDEYIRNSQGLGGGPAEFHGFTMSRAQELFKMRNVVRELIFALDTGQLNKEHIEAARAEVV